MFQRHAHVTVWVERTEGAKLCILQQQHGLWSQTHGYHGDYVGVLQLVQDGHLRLETENCHERITGSSQLASTGEHFFLHLALYHGPSKVHVGACLGLKVVSFPDHIFCARLAKSNLGTRLV